MSGLTPAPRCLHRHIVVITYNLIIVLILISRVHGLTPLMLATKAGHIEVVRILLRSNADVSLKQKVYNYNK